LTLEEIFFFDKLRHCTRLGSFLGSVCHMLLQFLLQPHNTILVICQLFSLFSLVWLTGSKGRWNLFWLPTAPARGGADRLAVTKLSVSTQLCSSLASL
ncbi:unnamed protein product, partial [Ixodes pacificus]